MNKTTAALFATSTVFALTLTGCSSDTSDSSNDAAPAAAATPATFPAAPSSSAAATAPAGRTPITITAGAVTVAAFLNDSDVSRDLIALLPLTTPAARNAGIEYIAELPDALTETGPFYTDVEAGDLVYYNPADTVTIIYAPTSSVPTLTKMGEVTSDLDVFENLPDDVEMTFELAS